MQWSKLSRGNPFGCLT